MDEASGKIPTREVAAKLLHHVLRQWPGVRLACMLQEGAEVLLHQRVQDSFLGPTRDVRRGKGSHDPPTASPRPKAPRCNLATLRAASDVADAFRLSLATSSASSLSDYERSYVVGGKRYHHIVDPRTGYPAGACRSVTIWATSALVADEIDDAVFILGPKKGLELVESLDGVGAVIVDAKSMSVEQHVCVEPRDPEEDKRRQPALPRCLPPCPDPAVVLARLRAERMRDAEAAFPPAHECDTEHASCRRHELARRAADMRSREALHR